MDVPLTVPIGERTSAADGAVSAIESFAAMEERGKWLPCYEPVELARVLSAKAWLNLNIRQWSAGVAEGTLFPTEIRRKFRRLPAWVLVAVMRQAQSLRTHGKRRIGNGF